MITLALNIVGVLFLIGVIHSLLCVIGGILRIK